MTNELFVKWSEGYFSEYRPVVEKEVLKLLSSWDEDLIDELHAEAMNTISTSFKTPPDIFFINNSVTAKEHSRRHRCLGIHERERFRALENNRILPAPGDPNKTEIEPSDKLTDLFKKIIGKKQTLEG